MSCSCTVQENKKKKKTEKSSLVVNRKKWKGKLIKVNLLQRGKIKLKERKEIKSLNLSWDKEMREGGKRRMLNLCNETLNK